MNNRIISQPTFYDIRAAEFDKFPTNASTVQARIRFDAIIPDDVPEHEFSLKLLVDRIAIEDRKGNM